MIKTVTVGTITFQGTDLEIAKMMQRAFGSIVALTETDAQG